MTIRSRLIVIVALAVGALLIVAALAGYNLWQMQQQLDANQRDGKELQQLMGGQVAFGRICESYHRAITLAMNGQDTEAVLATVADDMASVAAVQDLCGNGELARQFTPLREHLENGIKHIREDDYYSAVELFDAKLVEPTREFKTLLATCISQRNESIRAGARAAEANTRTNRQVGIACLVVAVALLLTVSLLTINRIHHALASLLTAARRLAGGDLSGRIQVRTRDEFGELGDAFNHMADALGQREEELQHHLEAFRTILQETRQRLHEQDGETDQVAEASRQLSDGATQQAAAFEEIAAIISQLREKAEANAANASQGQTRTQSALQATADGNAQMAQMRSAMEEISRSSMAIQKIIRIIDDIAFQTNLLALNAAVEAARAGRHGKGFSVVAQEVRNLASRSAKAARETGEMLESSIERVDLGLATVDKASAAIQAVTEHTQAVTELIESIACGSREQADGVRHVDTSVTDANRITEQNARLSEDLANSASALSQQTTGLLTTVEEFSRRHTETHHRTPSPEAQEDTPGAATPTAAALPPGGPQRPAIPFNETEK